MVRLDGVGVDYDGSPAVTAVDATVARGEWLCLIGPNGAGKSSLLRAIAALVPHRGRVAIDGRSTREMTHRQQARCLAYVPQQPQLPGGMTVLDYTLLGRTPHIGYFGVETTADRQLCHGLLERIGIGGLADRMLTTLSGGERQRATLARALAQQADVLLLDEPTSALDLGNSVEALELVDELRRERGLTIIAAMHDLTLAAQFADRLLLIDRGAVVIADTPAAVLTPERLEQVFGGSVTVMKDPTGALVVAPLRRAPS